MNTEVEKEILEFIEKNKKTYFNFLKSFKGFPYVCDYSSEISAAFLSSKFNTELCMIEGNFDSNEDLAHYWIKVNNTIIDFTLLQFLIPELKCEIAIENNTIYELVENTIPFPLIKDKNWIDRYDYLDEVSVSQELLDIADKSDSFVKYLNNIKPLYKGLIK